MIFSLDTIDCPTSLGRCSLALNIDIIKKLVYEQDPIDLVLWVRPVRVSGETNLKLA